MSMLVSIVVLAFGFVPQETRGLDARPAGVPLPPMPSVERTEPYLPPPPGDIARDGVVAQRFTDAGQRVSYAFDAAAGELSLFELSATGFARGWKAGVLLRVVDGAGKVLGSTEAQGGVLLGALLPFEAPTAGRFALEVVPTEAYFRFVLVRHSSYPALNASEAADVGERARVHTWVGARPGSRRLRVPLRAGEEICLRVEGTREEARKERRSRRELALDGGAQTMAEGAAMAPMMDMRSMTSRGALALHGGATIALADAPGVLQRGPTLVRLEPERDGEIEVVLEADSDQPALIDLVIERGVVHPEVAGAVIDAEDNGLSGLTLEFLREPELDMWCTTTTGADGAWNAQLPQGNWRVRVRRSDVLASVLRLGVTGPARDLLLLLPGGA